MNWSSRGLETRNELGTREGFERRPGGPLDSRSRNWHDTIRTSSTGKDFMTLLRSFALDASIPQQVRKAADRLQARLSPEFESVSTHPVEDAEIIVQFILEQLF